MSAEYEAQILADLRRTHAQLKGAALSSTPAQRDGHHGWSMRLTIEEVDLLLGIVDERDDLKRRLLSDWEPDLEPIEPPAEVVVRRGTFPAGCPFRDVIHDCPLGGCPDASPREVQIPDLPRCTVTLRGVGVVRCSKTEGHDGAHTMEPVDDFPHGHPEIDEKPTA